LGLCSWWFHVNTVGSGLSFFGNGSGYNTIRDTPTYSHSDPFITFAGGGGSDRLEFPDSGLYLVQFQFTSSLPSPTFNNVDIGAVSTLTNVSLINGSKNETTFVYYSLVSFDLFNTLEDGYITFPNEVTLSTLYGAGWAYASCGSFSIIRLS